MGVVPGRKLGAAAQQWFHVGQTGNLLKLRMPLALWPHRGQRVFTMEPETSRILDVT